MEISEIKQNLFLSQILHHYGLKPNKNNMLNCPWHKDKTASLQVNLEKNFYKCHACGKKGDQIQWVQDYEKISKHEALKKCATLINPNDIPVIAAQSLSLPQSERIQFLEKMFQSFRKGIFISLPAKDYCRQRSLDLELLQIGFNGGQFHHGSRRDETLIHHCLAVGLLLDNNLTAKTGQKAYNVFGNRSLVFPLKNKENQIVSVYFRSILNNDTAKHFYLKNRQGLYPNYPNPTTKKLILTESIIDCASLLQITEIIENYSVLACYGTNGLTEEIQNAIKEWVGATASTLGIMGEGKEIVFCFDTDDAGKQAVQKYTKMFADEYPELELTTIELPNKDINETLQLHEPEIFTELLEKRNALHSPNTNENQLTNEAKSFLSSNESFSIKDKATKKPTEELQKLSNTQKEAPAAASGSLRAIDILKQKKLIQTIGKMLGEIGIVGEENNRILLFIIITSYITQSPLHAVIQGSSGSGKSFLIGRLASIIPPEDLLQFTRITESSLYNYGEYDLVRKVLIIEDLDGLKEEALYGLRELISNLWLRSLTSIKDKKGNSKGARKEVKGIFSSLCATTKGEMYEDNMNRSFIIAVDESIEQTQRIIDYQNQKNAGEIDKKAQERTQNLLQQIIRNLKDYEVVNPYAKRLTIPDNVRNKRRLNDMIQSIIKQITIINQYQRESSPDPSKGGGRKLITEIEDLENGIEILFESIILKIDELDGSLRQFLEKLKARFSGEKEFTRFEAMEITGFKKSQLQVYLNELVRFEYLKQTGHPNKGFKYKIAYFDNMVKVRQELKKHFNTIIEQLKTEASGS